MAARQEAVPMRHTVYVTNLMQNNADSVSG